MMLTDKKGCSFEVEPFKSEDLPLVVEMYDAFTPKLKFQGMPPLGREACEEWVKKLVEVGSNFLAWREGKVIGHVVLLPDVGRGDAEYLIFVDQFNRSRGVGTALTRTAIQMAEGLGLKTVWLTVEVYNFRATRLYRKCGFSFCEAYESSSERIMEYICGCKDAP